MDKFFEIGVLVLGSIYALSHLLRTIYLFKDDDERSKGAEVQSADEDETPPPMSEVAKRMYS